MKKSISFKLFSGFVLGSLIFLSFFIFLNTRYMGEFYLKQKQRLLRNTAADINRVYTGDIEEIDIKLESLERDKGLSVIILDAGGNIKYVTRGKMRGMTGRREIPFWFRFYEMAQARSGMELVIDPVLNTRFLNMFYWLDNGDFLILSTPLAAVEESVEIARRFFLLAAVPSLLLGSLVVFFWAWRFTHPIREMNNIAQKMARLDFSQRCEIKSEDELGELAESLNSLSYQLDRAIRELKEANLKLEEDIEKERKLDQMRKEFVYNVSHELKTPLSLIRGYAEGLKLNVAESEEDKNFYCDVIIDEAEKMNKLVRELLDLAQIESGYMKLEKDYFDLSSFISQVLHKYEPIFADKGVKLEVEKPAEVVVYADSLRVEEVLTNYINNAVNYVDGERKIRIRVEEDEERHKVRVRVYNSGSHIPEEALDKVFISFYKVDKARTRSYGGTGLGLAIVKAIQELDNNAYGVANVEGGVEFYFELDKG
ncbi:HAMP domain-containing protein [Thermosyntropha lipolytica DSM 11003]|uniref:histidine kinase n=1 Tax=Thermosyntropha lipolytica DSM 11003 TaxID=1123382 RepID=A0A1M5PQ66_9FIRM|nr:HAMP domain-containing sensor histidine kinase [Thermosyntropha lipolytica]SHH04015.1 HAMP domain-containing protein [Thermosyntropha lipolytica DSM 11003]